MVTFLSLNEATSTLLINALIFIVILIMACFSAKRLNFIHGLIVGITWFFLLAGVYQTLTYLVMKGNPDLLEFTNKFSEYTACSLAFPVATITGLDSLLDGAISKMGEFNFLIYYAPIVLWIISRLVSGSIRNRRYY